MAVACGQFKVNLFKNGDFPMRNLILMVLTTITMDILKYPPVCGVLDIGKRLNTIGKWWFYGDFMVV